MELLSRQHNHADSHIRVCALVCFSPVRLRRRFATARSRLTPRMLSLSSRFASLMLLGLGTMLLRIAQRALG